MRSRHGETALEARHLSEQLAAVEDSRPGFTGGRELDVVVGDRGGHHHVGTVRKVARIVADRGREAQLAKALCVGRLRAVGTADLGAEAERHDGESAHSRAADSDEVEPASAPRRVAHAAAR